MAISGKFIADFESFEAATRKAIASLAGMEAGSAKAAAAADRINQSLGGAGTAAGTTVHAQFQKFDSILASLGLNIGTDVRALGELTTAAGQTASSMGSLATAGLTVGAAFAGWKIGRWISDLGEFDTKIGDLTASLLGLGDVAGMKAASGADTLARASKLAGFEIHDMGTAIKILQADVEAHMAAVNTSENRIKGWNLELARLRSDGTLALLNADIQSQNFELKELSERYGISVDAIQFFTREQKNAADAQKASDDAIVASNKKKMDALEKAAQQADKLFEATTHLAFAQGNYTDILLKADPVLVEAIKHYQQLGLSVQDIATLTGLAESKVQLISTALQHQNDVLEEAHRAWQALEAAQAKACEDMLANTIQLVEAERQAFKKAEEEIIARQHRISETFSRTYDLSTPEGMAEFKRLNPMATFTGAATDIAYFLTHTLEDAIRAGLVNLYGGYTAGPPTMRIPPFGHPIGGDTSGMGGTIVNVNGSVLGTPEQIEKAVGNALMSRALGQGQRFSVGA